MKQQFSLLLVLIFSLSILQIATVNLKSKFKTTINNEKQNQEQLVAQNTEENSNQQIKYDESLGYRVIKKIPRDLSRLYYTQEILSNFIQFLQSQGFKFINQNTIVESSGLYGESVIHYVDSNTFQVKKETSLSQKFFGEGCAVFTTPENKKEIHQMTWRERKIFAYDADTLSKIKEFDLPSEVQEGWGLCTIKKKNEKGIYEDRFLATDGSNQIFEINPTNWSVVSKTPILNDKGQKVTLLNDLEVINDNIFVNLYLAPVIIQLDSNYKFKRAFDFEQLRKEVFDSDIFFQNGFSEDSEYCLNGIAYDKSTNRIFITGKKWPYVYEIEFYELN